MSTDSEDMEKLQSIALQISKRQNQRCIGAAVHKRVNRSGMDDEVLFSIELYDFMDNEQYSNLDAFLVQMGSSVLYLSDEYEDSNRGDGRKLVNLSDGKGMERVYTKKSLFTKKADVGQNLLKLCGKQTHSTNVAETERPLAYACLDCLMHSLRLLEEEENLGKYDLRLGSLNQFMRLDSAAAEAVNLLPKPDHPSQFGSIYGVLNRCKTKMGARLLERWLRQPLIDVGEINRRLDTVEVFKSCSISRNKMNDGPLKGVPDLDAVIAKMQKKTAGLSEVFKLYLFTRALPQVVNVLTELVESCEDGVAVDSPEKAQTIIATIRARFLGPLDEISGKFTMFQQLVEHVMDLDQLPELVVNAKHDPELEELHSEKKDLETQADKLLRDARNSWASFADVKLEPSQLHGFVFRTTRADDERQLRANNSNVRIISILKNGVHFTTPALERISDRFRDIEREYESKQQDLVVKAVETATTYLPVVEAATSIIAELDVLTSFATAAALSPGDYVRPNILPRGSGVMDIQAARHPCVELMDGVEFIPNSYVLKRDESNFQIITGPNMGGKSTYIRGIGSIVVMAQVGSFVPCESAEISVVDCLLARVGAGDAVQKGVSTFMAEMLEASVILETATSDSLLIIDELGRGTSTFDGFGIAWAISEYIVSKIGCMCLFATHFHELTALASQQKGVVNRHVTAHIDGKQVVMLYSVQDGPCTESFGIHVATMAKFPSEVINEAKRKAKELECIGADTSTEEGREKQRRIVTAMEEFASYSEKKFAEDAAAKTLRKDLRTIFSSPTSVAISD